jgi:septal ring factor EnvC (AmiA/AmiB activator)
MERLIEELQLSIANLSLEGQQHTFQNLKGNLIWPVKGAVINSWGSNYGLGDLNWQGITISAENGSDVRAVHHGRVVFADWFSSSGLLLIIDHGGGYMSLYAHNKALFRDVGEWVNSGDIIASVGNTGGQQEYGLYFEIRYNGESENPSGWLMARN